ncbi:MAG: zinc-ribbon domain-containing protein [Actinomycetota bacterium]|nr:zinc-ribbon domain-containing protein [Actinomycetota bacterium]
MVNKCKECGQELPENAESPYCEQCDEMLDKRFDKIEDDILVYKDLTPEEIEILKKFDKDSILELYAKTYLQFTKEGQITDKEEKLLKKLRDNFSLGQKEIESSIEFVQKLGKEFCPDCHEPIKDDYNLCPYCGYKLNQDFKPAATVPGTSPNIQDAWGPMLKSPGCLIILGLILVAIIVYLIYQILK